MEYKYDRVGLQVRPRQSYLHIGKEKLFKKANIFIIFPLFLSQVIVSLYIFIFPIKRLFQRFERFEMAII